LAASDIDTKGRRHWHEIKGRSLSPLVATPDAWQPEDWRTWKWPNGIEPEPLPITVVGAMTVSGGVEFSAVDAAAEMEAERDDLRRTPTAEPVDPPQWWRDVARVQYQPMGSVTVEHGEARIMRHLIVERSLTLDMRRQKTNAAVLVDLKRTLADVYGEVPGDDWVPPLTAMPEDWRDFEVVMGWMAEVMPSRREVFVLRSRMQAPPRTWVQIGDEIRRSDTRCRQIYAEVIGQLVAAANRPPRRAPARLRELQERNREARRA